MSKTKDFIAIWAEQAKEFTFDGRRLDELTREELLALAAYGASRNLFIETQYKFKVRKTVEG